MTKTKRGRKKAPIKEKVMAYFFNRYTYKTSLPIELVKALNLNTEEGKGKVKWTFIDLENGLVKIEPVEEGEDIE